VVAISRLFDDSRSTLLLGDEAKETTVRSPGFLSQFRILHFATHGLTNERFPKQCCLALAASADSSMDGFLQAGEIYGLSLNADLVVLSACETGKGKMVRGEGVLGLPRAFLYAGARNVVVSLWSVSDEGTAKLMTSFYREMIVGKRLPGEALARAKEAMIQTDRWHDPFYWAGFVLIGPG
jgi:CHAT domain-containing protein